MLVVVDIMTSGSLFEDIIAFYTCGVKSDGIVLITSNIKIPLPYLPSIYPQASPYTYAFSLRTRADFQSAL